MSILDYILSFCLFCILQSLFINGLYYAFKWESKINDKGGFEIKGNILYPLSLWVSKREHPFWVNISRPLYSCVRCMSSLWGAVTFFPFIIYVFGFYWFEIGLYICDVLILTSLNWWVYKKL